MYIVLYLQRILITSTAQGQGQRVDVRQAAVRLACTLALTLRGSGARTRVDKTLALYY